MNLFSEFPQHTLEDWLNVITKDLKGKPLESLLWNIENGLTIAPWATEVQAPHEPSALPLSRANLFHTTQQGWQAIQPVNLAEEGTFSRIREDVEADIHAFLLFSPNPEISDYMQAMREIPVDKNAVHIQYPELSVDFFSALFNFLGESGQKSTNLTGTFTSSLQPSQASTIAAIIQKNTLTLPYLKTLGINLEEYSWSIVLQLAAGFAQAVEWVEILKKEGLDSKTVFHQYAFTFPSGGSFFAEVAKLRAFRKGFGRIAEIYGVKDCSPFLMAGTSSLNLAHYDAYTNILRITTEVMSGIMGGANGVIASPFTQNIKETNAFSHRVSRNIHHLLKHESYLDKVADAAGGAYYIEALTQTLAEKSWEMFQEIERQRGFWAVKESGWLNEKITLYKNAARTDTDKRKKVFIGVNQYPDTGEVLEKETLSAETVFMEFEAIRKKTENYTLKQGKRPSVHLLTFGDIGMRNARALFCRNLIGCGGFEITEGEEIAGSPVAVVLCSSDETYFTEGMQHIQQCRASFPGIPLYLAGKPENMETLGVDGNLYAGISSIQFLSAFQIATGIH